MLVVNNPTATLEKPLGLSQQLADAKTRNKQLTDDNEQINRALDKERNDDRQTRGKLETENVRLQQEDERKRTEIVSLNKEVRNSVAAMDAAHKTLASLREENEKLRTDIQAARTDRDKTFKDLVDKTDKLHNTVDELAQLKERNVELAAEFAKAKECLRYFGQNYKTDYKSKVPPHPLEGLVLEVTSDKVVGISLGSDDGLKEGHQLEVTRGGKYVGRIQVTRTTPASGRLLDHPEHAPESHAARRSCHGQALVMRSRSSIASRSPTSTRCCWCSPCWPSSSASSSSIASWRTTNSSSRAAPALR